MKDKVKNKLTKQFKYEDIILILVGFVVIVIGILILLGIIKPGNYENNSFSIILILMGVISIVTGIVGIVKKRKYQNSIFYDLYKDYDNNLITEKLINHGLNYHQVDIYADKNSIEISTKTKSGTFILVCFRNNLIYSFDIEEETNQGTSEILEEHDTLNITLDEMYLKFALLANQYKNK